MKPTHILFPALVLAVPGCGSEEPAAVADACGAAEAAAVADLASGERTWRDSVEELVQTAPPDSIVRVGISLAGTDRQLAEREIAAVGGEITYWFTIMPWLIAELPASGLAEIYTRSWVLAMSIGRPGSRSYIRCGGGTG